MKDHLIDEVIDLCVKRTRLDETQVRLALSGALGLLDKHAAPDPMTTLYGAVPGARDLANSADGKAKPGGGLFGGLMKSAGGVSGAAMADAMGLLSRLSKAGIERSDLKLLLRVAEEWVAMRTGRNLLREAMASVPGVGSLLEGRRAAAG